MVSVGDLEGAAFFVRLEGVASVGQLEEEASVRTLKSLLASTGQLEGVAVWLAGCWLTITTVSSTAPPSCPPSCRNHNRKIRAQGLFLCERLVLWI